MNTRELRIGNLILIDGSICKVNSIFENPLNPEKLEPITITEEWLIKLEFKEEIYHSGNKDYNIGVNGFGLRYEIIPPSKDIRFYPYEGFKRFKLIGDGGYDNEGEMELDHIKYIHQLQNLYFALTGKELEIKPNY